VVLLQHAANAAKAGLPCFFARFNKALTSKNRVEAMSRRKPPIEGAIPAGLQTGLAPAPSATDTSKSVDEFLWNIVSISNYFEEISFAWAQMLGVNVHQWMILMAVKDLDRGGGISVKGVSAKLHADPSFVTSQSKSLEKLGYVQRVTSSEDARVVLMSLTTKACKEIANLHSVQEPIKQSIFSELDETELHEINGRLSLLRERFQRSAKRLAAEL
jgi:MarR family transcriptional regulator, organic hydroperoxide resistance regulator